MANSPEDLLRFAWGFIGSSGKNVLGRQVSDHFDTFVKGLKGSTGDDPAKAFDDWMKKLEEDNVPLQKSEKEFLRSNDVKFLFEGDRLEQLRDFGEILDVHFASAAALTKDQLDNALVQLGINTKLVKEGASIADVNDSMLGSLAEYHYKKLAKRDESLGKIEDRLRANPRFEHLTTIEMEQAARDIWESELKKTRSGKNSDVSTHVINPSSGGSSGASPSGKSGGADPRGTSGGGGGGGAGDPPLTKAELAEAAKITPLAEKPWWQVTGGAWRSYAVAFNESRITLKNTFSGDLRRPGLSLPNFGISQNHIKPRINYANKHLVKSGAFKQFTSLESEMNKVSRALETSGKYDGVDIVPENFMDEMEKVCTKFANDDGFRESLSNYKRKMLILRENIENIKLVDDKTKYRFINGMWGAGGGRTQKMAPNHRNQLRKWVNNQIDTADAYLKVGNDNQYLKEMRDEVEEVMGKQPLLRDKIKDGRICAQIMTESRIGRTMGSHYAIRKYGHNIAVDADGGFALKKNGNFKLSPDKVRWMQKHELVEGITYFAHNPKTRTVSTGVAPRDNVGAKMFNALRIHDALVNPAGTKDIPWDDGPNKNFIHSLLDNLFYREEGEAIQNMVALLTDWKKGTAVLNTTPEGVTVAIDDLIKVTDDEYMKEALRNLRDMYQYSRDNDYIGGPRDMARRYGFDSIRFKVKDIAEKELFNWRSIFNPAKPVSSTLLLPFNAVRVPYNWVTKFGGMSNPAAKEMRGHVIYHIKRGYHWATGADIKYKAGDKEALKTAVEDGENFVGREYNTGHGWLKTPFRIAYRGSGAWVFDPRNWQSELINWPFPVKPVEFGLGVAGVYATANAAESGISYVFTDKDDKEDPAIFGAKLGGQFLYDMYTPLKWFSKGTASAFGAVTTLGYNPGWINNLVNPYTHDKLDGLAEKLQDKSLNAAAVARGERDPTLGEHLNNYIGKPAGAVVEVASEYAVKPVGLGLYALHLPFQYAFRGLTYGLGATTGGIWSLAGNEDFNPGWISDPVNSYTHFKVDELATDTWDDILSWGEKKPEIISDDWKQKMSENWDDAAPGSQEEQKTPNSDLREKMSKNWDDAALGSQKKQETPDDAFRKKMSEGWGDIGATSDAGDTIRNQYNNRSKGIFIGDDGNVQFAAANNALQKGADNSLGRGV